MKKAYLSGPMMHIAKDNFPAFMEGQKRLEKHGWIVINPAQMNLGNPSFHFERGRPASMRYYAERDLFEILGLEAERGDALVLLDNWEKSNGSQAERAVAVWVKLKILTLEEACMD